MIKTLSERNYFVEELQGDTLTPISIYQRLSGKKKFLLESSLKHENSGRYSFIGAQPTFELKGFEHGSILVTEEGEESISQKPLELLKDIMPKEISVGKEKIPFIGRSEERRVGKECRAGCGLYHKKKKREIRELLIRQR